VSNNADYGVDISYGSAGNFANSTISSNTYHGLFTSFSSFGQIEYGTVTNNGGVGVYSYTGSSVIAGWGTITGNAHGVSAYKLAYMNGLNSDISNNTSNTSEASYGLLEH